MEQQKIRVAILGSGTVGGGVYKLLKKREAEMPNIIGMELEVAAILVRNVTKKREGIPAKLLTDDFEGILNDPGISIVIELMGGIEPARTYILKALRAGKHVVTANKDLMATHGHELMDAAKEHGCDLQFEAAVAGAIPIIRPLKQCLAGNEISEVMGIVNGTTNFILTNMSQKGEEFADCLKEAQALGYAEADPTADVEGLDAGRKMAILASIAFHSRVVFDQVYTEGITKISSKDIQYAKEMGCTIKLLGVAKSTEEGIEVGVYPMLLSDKHPLSHVNDAFNAVFVHGDAVDDVMFQGRGAGEFPTASAVVGDIIDTARSMREGSTGRIGCTCYHSYPVKRMEDTKNRFFIRLKVEDRPGVLAGIASVLGNNDVSISQMIQKTSIDGVAELVVMTEAVQEKHFNDALKIMEGMAMVKEISSVLRVHE